MIVLKKTHEALLAAKDEQIKALKDEIAFLRHYIQPRSTSTVLIQEADAILGGEQSAAPTAEELAVISERDRLLSGTYE